MSRASMHWVLILVLAQFVVGQEKVAIDLKVPLLETADLAPAQLGASLFLARSDWATMGDVNEDVAVWLKDYDRRTNWLGQQVIECTMEIREPSLIRIGNLKTSTRIRVRYRPKKMIDKYDQQILNELDALSEALQIEGYLLGRKIEKDLKSILQ